MNTKPPKTPLLVALEVKGISPEQLAERTGISARQIRYWAAGKGLPRLDRAHLIARELGVKNPIDLFPMAAA